MEYNEKSLTREGATMMALADKEQKSLNVDGLLVSEKIITAGTDISALTMDSFTDSVQFPINAKVQSAGQFTVRSVITNHYQDTGGTDHDITKDFNIALVGVVAHVDGYADQHVLSVAVGNEPFVLPAYQGTPFNLVFGVTQAFSASQNVTIKIDNSAYALATDVDDLKSTVTNLNTSVTVTIDEKLKDAATLSGSNEFKGTNKFDVAPTDSAGNAYVTAAGAVTANVDAISSAAASATSAANAHADTAGSNAVTSAAVAAAKTYQPLISAQNGDVAKSVGSGADLSATLMSLPRGLTSIYVAPAATNNPSGSAMHGWVQMYSATGTAAKGGFIDSSGNLWAAVVNGTTVTYKQMLVDNGDGTVTLDGRKFTPADEDHVVTVSDAGKGSKVNFDYGDLTVDGDPVFGMHEMASTDDIATYKAAHPHTMILVKDATTATDTTTTS